MALSGSGAHTRMMVLAETARSRLATDHAKIVLAAGHMSRSRCSSNVSFARRITIPRLARAGPWISARLVARWAPGSGSRRRPPALKTGDDLACSHQLRPTPCLAKKPPRITDALTRFDFPEQIRGDASYPTFQGTPFARSPLVGPSRCNSTPTAWPFKYMTPIPFIANQALGPLIRFPLSDWLGLEGF